MLELNAQEISVDGIAPIWKNALDQGLIEKPLMAFYLSKTLGSRLSLKSYVKLSSSELSIGAVNPKLYTGQFVYTYTVVSFIITALVR